MIYTYWRDWLPDQPGKITQKGYPIIFMEWSRFYLSATPSDEGLSSLYNFEFEPQFPGIVKQNVLGFQACVWTEMIPNERKFSLLFRPFQNWCGEVTATGLISPIA